MNLYLKRVSRQGQRAINNQETVIHIILLLPIQQSERVYLIENLKFQAVKQNLKLLEISFRNTSSETISIIFI
jgi:hypothetical protein